MDYVVGSIAALISGNVTPNRPKQLKKAYTPIKNPPSPNVTPKSEFVEDRSIFLSPTMQKKKAIVKKSPKRIFQNPNLDVTNDEDGESSILSPKADKAKKHLKEDLEADVVTTRNLLSPKSPKNEKSPKKNKKISDNNVEDSNENISKNKKKKRKSENTENEELIFDSSVIENEKENTLSNSSEITENIPKKRSKKSKTVERGGISENSPNLLEDKEKLSKKKNKQVTNENNYEEVTINRVVAKQQSPKKKNKERKKTKEHKSKDQVTNKDTDSEYESGDEIESKNEEINTNTIVIKQQSPKKKNKKRNKSKEKKNNGEVTKNAKFTVNSNTAMNKDGQTDSEHESDDEIESENDEISTDTKQQSPKKKNKKRNKSKQNKNKEIRTKAIEKFTINPNAVTNKDTDSEHDSDDEINSENEEINRKAFDIGPVDESSDEGPDEEKIRKEEEKAKKNDAKMIREYDEEETKRTIFVGNVPFSKKCKKEVKNIFSQYGEIETVRIRTIPVKDARDTPKMAVVKQELHPDRTTVNAYVRYADLSSVDKALSANNTVMKGCHLRVSRSESTGAPHDPRCSVFVGNMPFALEDEALRAKFEMCGEIESVRIIRDKTTNVGKGFGYVNFASKDGVELALALTEEDLTIKNRILRVKRCTQPTQNQLQKRNSFNKHGGNIGNNERKNFGRGKFGGRENDDKNSGAYRRLTNKRKNQDNGEGPPNKKKNLNQPNREKKPRKEFVGMTAEKKKKNKFNKGQKKKKALSEILTK